MEAGQATHQVTELLQAAAELLHYQCETLRDLAEKAKSMHKQGATEQQPVQLRLEQIALELAELQGGGASAIDRHDTARIARLHEEEEQLRGRERRLTDELAMAQKVSQQLSWLVDQCEVGGRYARGEAHLATVPGSHTARLTQLRILQAQEGERQRLAREIHDGPAQVLANAIFELEYCEKLIEKDPGKLPYEIARLKKDIRAGLAEVRNFIFDLRPTPVDDTGLPAMLRHYAENYQSRFRIDVRLELSEVGRVATLQETAVYRIVQEALQNAQKHSRATAMTIRLSREGETIRVEIEDNGVGFLVPKPGEEQPGHWGLMTIRERAQLIGGQLDIVSTPRQGTKVILAVPLGAATQEDPITTS